MRGLTRLLFELASAERSSILFELQRSNLKLSQISRKLGVTMPEASRHVQRLTDNSLIRKNPDGTFVLTQFGKLTIFLLENLSFLSLHRDYFLEYDVDGVPNQFLDRLGDLTEAKYSDEALINLQEGERKIREAKEYVWILCDSVFASVIPSLEEKVKSSFDLRIILPIGKFPPETESRLPLRIPWVQKKVLPKVDVLVVLTEEYAVFCLPNHTGKIDYTGFVGGNGRFHQWCKDLFLHYWEKAPAI